MIATLYFLKTVILYIISGFIDHPCIGAVEIAELKLQHYEILILPLRYLTKHQDQYYRFTDYKLSTT
jgi:hypothetical protein